MIRSPQRPADPRSQKRRKRVGGAGTNSKCPTGHVLRLSGFTNRVRSQGRRAPTRQSVCDATRTILYIPNTLYLSRGKIGLQKGVNRLDSSPHNRCAFATIGLCYFPFNFRGRTGFDLKFEAQAACRGWFVGLVKNRTKKNKRRSPRSRSRGLIDRDVWSWTPATAPNVDSRLIVRRSDRVER